MNRLDLIKQLLRKDSNEEICLPSSLNNFKDSKYIAEHFLDDTYSRTKKCSYKQNKNIDQLILEILEERKNKINLKRSPEKCFRNKRIKSPECVKKYLIDTDINLYENIDEYVNHDDLNYIYIQNPVPIDLNEKNRFSIEDYKNLVYHKGFFSSKQSPFHLVTIKNLLKKN